MTKKRCRCTAILALGLFVVFCGGMYALYHATSSTKSCLSCHEMKPYAHEQQFSAHARDKGGETIGCSQCHIPQGFGPRSLAVKMYSGIKDLTVHFWAKPERLNRVLAQETARRFVDDANCLACHEDVYKDAKGEAPVSAYGRLAHDAYFGKNGNTKYNCAGCHINLAHLPEFDRRLRINAAFSSRLRQEEAKR